MRYLFAGLAGLALVWLVAPPLTPPLFDTVNIKVPPYRYLQPPPGVPNTPPPTSGRFTDAVSNGQTVEAYVTTTESPAQAILALGTGALNVPKGIKNVIVTIRPVRPPYSLSPGLLDGNVYLLAARTPTGQPVDLVPGATARILLRKTGAEATAVIEHGVAGHWVQRPTAAFVNAGYLTTSITQLGYYALVLPSAATPQGPNKLLIIAGVVVVILVIGALLALRSLRRPPVAA
ncbi:MAG TPA: hypothetical protein VFB58_12580 [Chloroflexota bacterium]|nr:hypothetical protein [Chloroflexota bacterium]